MGGTPSPLGLDGYLPLGLYGGTPFPVRRERAIATRRAICLFHLRRRTFWLDNIFQLRSELNNSSYSNDFPWKLKVTILQLISQEEIKSRLNILKQEICCFLFFVYEKVLLKTGNCKLTASGILAKLKHGL